MLALQGTLDITQIKKQSSRHGVAKTSQRKRVTTCALVSIVDNSISPQTWRLKTRTFIFTSHGFHGSGLIWEFLVLSLPLSCNQVVTASGTAALPMLSLWNRGEHCSKHPSPIQNQEVNSDDDRVTDSVSDVHS